MGEKNKEKVGVQPFSAQDESMISPQLIHSQKMEAMGQLIAGIAHEFNNVLTPIIGNAQLARLSMEEEYSPEIIQQCFDEILKCAFRARDTIKQLVSFTNQGKYNPVDLDINEVIRESSSLLHHAFASIIPYSVKNNTRAINLVHADRSQMAQIINNLALNARESMPRGGEILITSRDVYFSEPVKGLFDTIPVGEYVELVVSDNGIGIEEVNLKKIFDPFFSTKKGSRLVGLGLAVVWNIVKSHNGYIKVDTKSGRGSSFSIYFPSVRRIIEAKFEAKTEIGGTARRILIVDDDNSVRKMTSKYLKILGYDIITASDGREGLDLFKKGGIDLVLADLIMENMDGEEMYHEIRKVDPRAKVFIMSGYQKDERVRHLLENGAIGFISKPFKLQELDKILRNVLKENNKHKIVNQKAIK